MRTGSWMGPPQGKRAPMVGPICVVIIAREWPGQRERETDREGDRGRERARARARERAGRPVVLEDDDGVALPFR